MCQFALQLVYIRKWLSVCVQCHIEQSPSKLAQVELTAPDSSSSRELKRLLWTFERCLRDRKTQGQHSKVFSLTTACLMSNTRPRKCTCSVTDAESHFIKPFMELSYNSEVEPNMWSECYCGVVFIHAQTNIYVLYPCTFTLQETLGVRFSADKPRKGTLDQNKKIWWTL